MTARGLIGVKILPVPACIVMDIASIVTVFG